MEHFHASAPREMLCRDQESKMLNNAEVTLPEQTYRLQMIWGKGEQEAERETSQKKYKQKNKKMVSNCDGPMNETNQISIEIKNNEGTREEFVLVTR